MTRRNTHIHTYAMLLLRDHKLSQTRLAEICQCNVSTINRILLGTKTSAAIQRRISQELGFSSWKQLERASDDFQRMFVQLHRKEA